MLTQFGQIDILVNAAGQIFRKPTVEISEAEWDGLMDVNLTGMLRTCQSFYPALAANRRGRIVNIASLNSYRGAGAGGGLRALRNRRCSRSRAAWRWSGRSPVST